MTISRYVSKKALVRVSIVGMVAAMVVFTLYSRALSKMQGPEGSYLVSVRMKIHFTVDGDGPPLLLLHGMLLNGNLNWRVPGFVDKLAKHYKVITVDLRGHGRSSKPHDPKAYGMEVVEDLLRLMDSLHIEKAHLAGVSLGGLIAERFMIAHPDRVLTVSVAAQGISEPNEADRDLANRVADSLEHGYGIGPLNELIGVKSRAEWASIWFSTNFLNDPKAMAAFMRQLPSLAVSLDAIKANQTPLHIIIGEKDGFLPAAKTAATYKPNTTLDILPGRTHMMVGGKELVELLLPHQAATAKAHVARASVLGLK